MIYKAKEQPSELFSYRGMARRVTQNVWPQALVGGLILLIFLRDWRAFAALAILLVFPIARDAYRYGRCWEKHEQLKHAYPVEYPPLLEEREHGASTLVDRHWVDLRIGLMKKLGIKRMP